MTAHCACLPYCTCGWLKARMAAKSAETRRGILWTRCSPTHARTVLTEAAERNGKQWAELRAVAGRKKAA